MLAPGYTRSISCLSLHLIAAIQKPRARSLAHSFGVCTMLRLSRRLLPLVQHSSTVRAFALSSFERRLNEMKTQAEAGGGEKRVAAQHAKGKLTARERLSVLLDAGSFREYDQVSVQLSPPPPPLLPPPVLSFCAPLSLPPCDAFPACGSPLQRLWHGQAALLW